MPPASSSHSPSSPSSFDSSPFSLKFCLLVVGSAAALATRHAWKLKATKAFKASYITCCLTAGPAAILYASPDRAALEKKLRASRGAVVLPSAEEKEAQFRALQGLPPIVKKEEE